ncbi:ABC-type nickel/cobalt efflux system, permease component RcnA [Verrucomicrobium sp. GAS474]|nr:ABC-type nickel/cobalt efflux system, permease component RcnA [Verrucomicrobium sp. GAS474]
MMAAFIVAVRGTVGQAVLLGVSTAFSHSLVVWIVAMAGLSFGSRWSAEGTEPWFQMFSGLTVLALAFWMFRSLRRARPSADDHDHHDHHGHSHSHSHGHSPAEEAGLDDHARAHAEEIKRKFGSGSATTGQIILFGLTGGLVPCPASITVLMVCLQLKKVALGVWLVLCFSAGLALTMVLSGVVAALSLRHLSTRWSGFGVWAERAPWVSFILVSCLGLFFFWQGLRHLI